MRRQFEGVLLLALCLTIFFFDICFFSKTFSTSSLLPGTTPNGPYSFSGHRPDLPFSFDTGGNAWVNEPNPSLIRQVMDEGALPTWNPREGLGIPLIANLNTEVVNPLKVWLNLFPTPFSQDMFFLLRLFFMGLFTYLFLREMKLSHASSLLGSSSFMLSGYSVWWVNLHPLSTVMYLPAVFYFYERWSERKDLKSPFLMSLSLCFALTAGKIPDVIMGLFLLFLYAVWKGILRSSLRGISREGGRVIIATVSGAFMASVVLVPFIELYAHASPLARAIRTGAAGHTIPLITSISLFQPLFLGWKNYFYASWLTWTPHVILPHAGIVVMVLVLYSVMHRTTIMKTLPFFVFSVILFFMVYGILPTHVIARLPVLGSIEFLKYNAMFYFSLSVMSASAFDHLLSEEGSKKKFYLSIAGISIIILSYFFALFSVSPPEVKGYMAAVLLLSLAGVMSIGLAFRFVKSRNILGVLVFLFLILELFLYMPKNHPGRAEPYGKPPYLDVIHERTPYRVIGDGSSIPPLVSNAIGLYDIRAISVLLPRDYYIYFENLLGFSVPQTNNPNPLFSATSPFIDLMGVKYILSQKSLNDWRLEEVIRSHITSLRWERLFDAMITHTIEGRASYGFFDQNRETRFSFFFPMRFAFETKLRVSEPFIFAGFALKDVPEGIPAKVKIIMGNSVTELIIQNGYWKDQWLDATPYMGEIVTVRIEGEGSGSGSIVLGDFGLSPGYDKEHTLYNILLVAHTREHQFLAYRGVYQGIHLYENKNVMGRAFMLHQTATLGSLDDIIDKLQEGVNFRRVGLVTEAVSGMRRETDEASVGDDRTLPQTGDKVMIKKYAPDEIAIDVETGGGLLVLSDLYYPGWKVRVNGKDEDIIRVFGVLRGVLMKSGKSEVLFTYRPVSLYAGIIISSATFVFWIVYLSAKREKKFWLIRRKVDNER